MQKITVAYIVPTLCDGGAETLIRNLIPRLVAEPNLDMHVISIYDPCLTYQECNDLGAKIHVIGRQSRRDISFAPRLLNTLRTIKPNIVHTHVHSGKFVGRIAALAAGVPNIVFTEHGDEAKGFVHDNVNNILNGN